MIMIELSINKKYSCKFEKFVVLFSCGGEDVGLVGGEEEAVGEGGGKDCRVNHCPDEE